MNNPNRWATGPLACAFLLVLPLTGRAQLPADTAIIAVKNSDGETRFAFSPDRKLLAVADYRGEVMLWNVVTENLWRSFKAHRGYVTYLAFSSDGKTLFTGSMRDKTVKTWRVSDQRGMESVDVYDAYGRGGRERKLDLAKVFAHLREKKLSSDRFRAVMAFHAMEYKTGGGRYTEYASCAAVNEDGKLAVVADNSTIAVWDLAKGEVVRTIKIDKPDDRHSHRSGSLILSPDGKRAAVDFLVACYLVDLEAGKILRKLKETDLRYAATFSNDGKLLALPKQTSGSSDEEVVPATLIDFATGKKVLFDETFIHNQKSRSSIILSDYTYWMLTFGARTLQRNTYMPPEEWTEKPQPRKHSLDVKVVPLPLPEPKD